MEMFPIYLRRLDERKTVLIGGDEEAEEKVEQLLDRNANLTVIYPHITDNMRRWADEGRFEWLDREYQDGDLEGAFMAIVAEYEGDLNERVYNEALERNILVNVMDDLPHANFAFGSIVRQGPLTLSISTSGAAPALAVRLRQRFEKEFGPEYGHFLKFMQRLRKPMSRHHPDFESRKKIWYELIDSGVIDYFRENQLLRAYEETAKIVGRNVVDEALKVETTQKED
ncbi:bifunctional precorrin-2 dehydrogenase/sirohydrochlorin ferrochelatase [Aliifodinibius sp. S!AR15-10]|uniref:precorrin-2 dehydrogenase/sirohydrochlorin ferrochelatase family protein n=1 Tax=Aliifodinibius sp. S!AR15-10 TaxID=2950437 RepID=UPI002858078D|nr:bifunctional precorrin-2 dehydrogenase/sirohydrochlorin ferrochelatase [Aliifodinibius sp. S!AR15-10]MDR8392275.1 bifunctional precorrin-2 dehydrogenase/sirohydrochlorin ferrochelatase [Aliifodinibius sp. S!AR15-10]